MGILGSAAARTLPETSRPSQKASHRSISAGRHRPNGADRWNRLPAPPTCPSSAAAPPGTGAGRRVRAQGRTSRGHALSPDRCGTRESCAVRPGLPQPVFGGTEGPMPLRRGGCTGALRHRSRGNAASKVRSTGRTPCPRSCRGWETPRQCRVVPEGVTPWMAYTAVGSESGSGRRSAPQVTDTPQASPSADAAVAASKSPQRL
jgi:hypothetical protein